MEHLVRTPRNLKQYTAKRLSGWRKGRRLYGLFKTYSMFWTAIAVCFDFLRIERRGSGFRGKKCAWNNHET